MQDAACTDGPRVCIAAVEVSTMGRIGLALKILFNGNAARKAAQGLTAVSAPAPEHSAPSVSVPVRSEAVTLLAALQREARFVDFIQESIDGYNDAQVGAAVRGVHRGCRDALARMFELEPVLDQEEETSVHVTDPASGRWRLTGNVGQSSGSASGRLKHSGWRSSKCQVPDWSGTSDDADVVAPAEVEIT